MVIDISPVTWLVLSAIAAHRVAELFVLDDGPFEIFIELRGWSVHPNPILKTIGSALTCVHCTGIYVSALFAVFYFVQNVYTVGIILLFAIAGLQSIVSGKLGRT